MNLVRSAVLFPIVGLIVASCGGTPGEKVRPKDETFAGAMGESAGACREPESGAEPLVVDWKPEQRGDLEVLMKDGVAVVSYSCKGFKLLKDCKVDGKYGFLGMTKKEQVVRLNNADEVKANLPLGGVGLAANIGAEMQRGATLDVALVMIGKVKTTWGKVAADELKGECDGATHFVKGATVGAFVMETGSKGEVKTAAQLFGAGAAGGSASTKSVRNQDGDLADCAKSAPDSPKAPSQCQAIVRLELKSILPKAKGDAPTEKASPPPETRTLDVATAEVACPKGMVLTEGKCSEPKATAPFLCKPRDAKECLDQCGKGHVGSCGVAGSLFASGSGAAKDETKARELLAKACDGGESKSCANLGVLMSQGRGGPKDAAGAAKSFEKACNDAADAMGCGLLGAFYEAGEGVAKDEAKGLAFLQKGCEGGHEVSCGVAGRMYLDGRGAPKDVAKGSDFMKRACDGGQTKSCLDLAGLYDGVTKDIPKNPIMAKLLYSRACFRGDAKGCTGQGRLELGLGGSPDGAKRAFEMACMRNDTLGCAAMKVLFGGTRPIVPNVAEMMELQKSCTAGVSRDCGAAGTLQTAAGQKGVATSMIERGCIAQDPLACAVKNKK